MIHTDSLTVTTPAPCEIVLTRTFDAPRRRVFDAMTKPALLARWFGPHGWSLVVCTVDLRVGGRWRFVLRGPDGSEMGMSGMYREIDAPSRLVSTEAFDAYPGEALATLTLVERDGRTIYTNTLRYPSQTIRDAVIASGMEGGAGQSYDRLAAVLAPPAAA